MYYLIGFKLSLLRLGILGVGVYFIIYHKEKIKTWILELILIKILCGGLKVKYDNFLSRQALRLTKLLCATFVDKGLEYIPKVYSYVKHFSDAPCPEGKENICSDQ